MNNPSEKVASSTSIALFLEPSNKSSLPEIKYGKHTIMEFYMSTTNSNNQSVDQFVSTLASLIEYINPDHAQEDIAQNLMAVYYGMNGDDDLLNLIAILSNTTTPRHDNDCIRSISDSHEAEPSVPTPNNDGSY